MWYEQAECKDYPENLWFGAGPGKQARAIAICNECSVRTECLEDALSYSDAFDLGTRGGTSARERRAIRKARRQKGLQNQHQPNSSDDCVR